MRFCLFTCYPSKRHHSVPVLAQASEADMQAVMASLVDRFDVYDTVIQAELQAGRGDTGMGAS